MTHEELLKQAREHWRECSEDPAEQENRARGREDARFAAGEQWDPATRRERELDKRPCLTFNRMPGFLHQVENEVRQNRIGITINPADNGIDKDTAKVDQGLIRHIQYDSKADTATHSAFVEACRSGLGAFKLVAQYVEDESFDQELKIEQIPDAIHRFHFDPFAKQPDRSDAAYAFEAEVLSHDEFKRQFGESATAKSNAFDGAYGNFDDDWLTAEGVRVANYWYVEVRRRKLLLLNSGQTVFADEAGVLPEGVTVEKEREVLARNVKCAKLNGVEVLGEYEWPGSTLPLFPVVGEELWVDGRRQRFSLTHFAQDPQRLYNYYRTSEAEVVGLAPKAPYVAAEGQLEGHEHQWATANTKNWSTLPYKTKSLDGNLVPAPRRDVAEPPIQALSLGAGQAADDMKATTGIYDASLGARSNETSGIAILRRQTEGDLSNLHFIDNLARAICACGRSIVEVKPRYYDTARQIRILGEDEKVRVVKVNQECVDEDGRTHNYSMSANKYDVRVSAGPSYTTQRQEAFTTLTEFVRAYPDLLKIGGDIVFRNSDVSGAEELADRFKRGLPPGLADDAKDGLPQIPPELQAQIQTLVQQNQQLTAALNQASEQARTKQLELASRENVVTLQEETKRAIALAQIDSREGLELLRQEIAQLTARVSTAAQSRQPEADGQDAAGRAAQESAAAAEPGE